MTQKSWPWSTTAAVGDGSAELNEASSREFLAHLWAQDLATEGVFKGLGGDLAGELAVSGSGSPLTVQPGAAICYGLYMSDAAENLTVTTPSLGTTGFRVVLRTNWAGTSDGDVGEAQTRLAVVENSDGVAAIPAVTQSFGTTWEISLATGTITTGGTISLTDDRTFRKATGITDTDELEDLAVTTAKIAFDAVDVNQLADAAVQTSKLAADAVTGAKVADDQIDSEHYVAGSIDPEHIASNAVTTAKIAAAAVTLAKMAAGAVDTSQLVNDAVTAAKIAAGAVDTSELAAGAVTGAKVANDQINSEHYVAGSIDAEHLAADIVDDTKVGNRVPALIRRQGGSASNWATQGNTDYTPTAVRMQVGVIEVASVPDGNVGTTAITFPTAFSATPIVIAVVATNTYPGIAAVVTALSASGCQIGISNNSGFTVTEDVHWLAIGPE